MAQFPKGNHVPDIVDKQTRSRMMAGIQGKNTRPELAVRKGLHALGFRYRLHDTRLPGRPDLVLPRYRVVIFVNGCFWHGHDCHLFKWPSTRSEWWRAKIEKTRLTDEAARQALLANGWRVADVWECALKGRTRLPQEDVIGTLAEWITSRSSNQLTIRGND